MNRKLISEAIGNIDDTFLAESLIWPENIHRQSPERTANMKATEHEKTVSSRKIISLLLAACLILALAGTAYAADIGGIRRIIQIWRYGELTTAVLDVQDGAYTLTDSDGSIIRGGGGVAMEPDGSERPLTEQELLEHLDRPDLRYMEDGTIWVYYRGHKINVTELFDEKGICYLELRDGEEVIYAVIEKNGGMTTSPDKYVLP